MTQEIKSKVICLYNKYGLSSVSMQQLAESIGISIENLHSHYKSKEEILICIYEDMYAESLHFSIPKNGYITLDHIENVMLKYEGLQNKYSFFYNELVYIIRNYPTIAKLHSESSIQRFKEARSLINYYVETGRFLPENRLSSYNKLIHSLWMIGTFWQSQRQVINCDEYMASKCHFVEMHWNVLIPFLTQKGLDEYAQIKENNLKRKKNTDQNEKNRQSFNRIWRKSPNQVE
ncbi:TetR/AcrR family transcriptional regulator [Aquimarina agarilytica]|uniref:TetR/AcrR family transcriptional regulator n=1 Tax=Aquimarina agarilytica TaxID=1087449 RepID=UPI0002880817|nr:TetR/AcrR family transcriptional regulator [Aquimarina agarilytica]